ncbi:Ribosomal RNA small subunit methyltransferase H [Alphaproteobacteria bacterium]
MNVRPAHIPVLLGEVLSILNPTAGGIYLDATFGAGGHSKAILDATLCKVYAIDRDMAAKRYADVLGVQYQERFFFAKSCFSELGKLCSAWGLEELNGMLFDVGVSSMQIDNPERGFSFYGDGPLLMTMGCNQLTAADIINEYPAHKLSEILWRYGEEKKAEKIAKCICEKRKRKRITSTLELAEIVREVVGSCKPGFHPATQTFQALRIAINDELTELDKALEDAIELLAVGGALIIITFQGLEDKIVKTHFRRLKGAEVENKRRNKYTHSVIDGTYARDCQKSKCFILINKKVIKPTLSELKYNKRARSAKLRAIRRIL